MNMCPSNKRKTSPELCLKGQIFFIWSDVSSSQFLKDRISLLGGKVDTFFSKEVTTLLVEDNHLAGTRLLSNDLTITSNFAPNGTFLTSFAYPNNLCNLPSTSRGFNFLGNNSTNTLYRIIAYARQWGIQILGVDQFLTWTEPQVKIVVRLKKKAIENVSNLTGCFIKFESFYKNYRPCYKMFNNDPNRLMPLKNANILLKPDTCNVILDKPVAARQLHITHMDISERFVQAKVANVPVKAIDKKPQNNKFKPKEENNYCECCRTHYGDLKQHIKSTKHKSFVSNEKNYESVHNILKMLPTAQEFIEKLQSPPLTSSALTNGDAPLCLSVPSIPDAEYPLNLQVKHDEVSEMPMPIDLQVKKELPASPVDNKDEELSVPLDLHVNKDKIKTEVKKFKETKCYTDNISDVKSPENIFQPKVDMPNEVVVDIMKIEEKIETNDIMQFDGINGESLLDRTNTAALAQLCLKDFESYWLDSLPCEMNDMVFDDIFDIDDGKKVDNDYLRSVGESIEPTNVPQDSNLVQESPSTPDLKLSTISNIPPFMSNSICSKSLENEQCNLNQTLMLPNSVQESLKDSLPPQNAAILQEQILEDKKQILNLNPFYSEKMMLEQVPSCSKTLNNKDEQLFSSESSDDENGNVLISNALHIITNSDSEAKASKESDDENFVQNICTENVAQKFSVVKSSPKIEESLERSSPTSHIIDTQVKNLPIVNNILHTKLKEDNDSCKENFAMQTDISNDTKSDVFTYKSNYPSSETKSDFKSFIPVQKYDEIKVNNVSEDDLIPAKKICPGELYLGNPASLQDSSVVTKGIFNQIKTDPESIPVTEQSVIAQETQLYPENKDFTNSTISPVEDKVFKSTQENISPHIKDDCSDKSKLFTNDYEPNSLGKTITINKITKLEQDLPIKTYCEMEIDQVDTKNSVLVEQPYFSSETVEARTNKNLDFYQDQNLTETIVTKLDEKISVKLSINQQYSDAFEKPSANFCSNTMRVESSVQKHNVKISHKKSSKLRKLAPLWSVAILPGNGVKLKFTCIRDKSE